MTPAAKKVVIIGGGISGLTAAFRLSRLSADNPVEISLIEAGSRFGNVIQTESVDQCLIECGPDNMLTAKPWGVNLMKELGMEEQILETDETNRRAFIADVDGLLPMPEGFRLIAPANIAALAASPCLSIWGKLRAIAEPLIPRHERMSAGVLPEDYDESLTSFVTRRLGKEALERLAQPLFSGIYTADPDTLSVRATMPQFLEYEAQYGSVIRGLKAGAKNGSQTEAVRYSMFIAPERGMGSLVDALLEQLRHDKRVSLRTDMRVSSLHFKQDEKQWRVGLADQSTVDADAIVLCLPAYGAANLLRDTDSRVSELLASIKYASAAVINFIVERDKILHPLNGFGFVVPAQLRKNILAGSFSSVKFKRRAPENLTILRAFVGGALFPEMLELSDARIRDLAFADLSFYLSIVSPKRGLPYREAIVTRWIDSMPQYRVGHGSVVREIERRVDGLAGAFLCGAAYEGVGIPDCIRNANQAAEAAHRSLFSGVSQTAI
ncbi:MAG: protoporphyrinogen oxidase [Candidatus Obscuribacterales bacterium]|nr:protoporphyrinogen oxidase [Candidatus Obscuribacterales bacterium]